MVSASRIGAGQHDDGRADTGAAQQAADLAPVHVGQADIEQDGVEALLGADVERRLAAVGFPAFEIVDQAQLLGQRLAQRLVVVDQQQAPPARRAIHDGRHGCCRTIAARLGPPY